MERLRNRGYLADKAMKLVVMQSFQNASKVIAASTEIGERATEVLDIKTDKICVLKHASMDAISEFTTELDAALAGV